MTRGIIYAQSPRELGPIGGLHGFGIRAGFPGIFIQKFSVFIENIAVGSDADGDGLCRNLLHPEVSFTRTLWLPRRSALGQRRVSSTTVSPYRDAFRFLLRYTHQALGKAPKDLELEDLNAILIGDFLVWLENERGCSIQSRNNRLAGIRALFRYASSAYLEHAAHIQRVLAIPAKRTEKAIVTYLTEEETTALLNAPTVETWRGGAITFCC